MQVFSLRAENQADADQFLKVARRAGVRLQDVSLQKEPGTDEVELEFSAVVSQTRVSELLVEAASGRLMRRTLRPVSREDNPMTFGPQIAFAV